MLAALGANEETRQETFKLRSKAAYYLGCVEGSNHKNRNCVKMTNDYIKLVYKED